MKNKEKFIILLQLKLQYHYPKKVEDCSLRDKKYV